MADSIRVQMSVETQEELKLLAEKYDCFYNKKPSLSILFGKIGKKELTIQPVESVTSPIPINNFIDSNFDLLILTMNCPFDVNGIVAKVTEKIADKEGNVFRINSLHESKNLGVLKLHLSLGKHEQENLAKMLDSIYSLTLNDINDFNTPEKMIAANNLLLKYHQTSSKENTTKAESNIEKELLDRNIIIDMSCIFGIEIISNNKTGTLKVVTSKIASNKALISSIVQNFNNATNEDILKVFLEIKISYDRLNQSSQEDRFNKISNEIGKIEKIINELESNIDGVSIKKVRRLNIYDLDALKNFRVPASKD